MRVEPKLVLLIASFAVASAANAVSLTMETDKSVYEVGEEIVITLLGDTTGALPDIFVFVDVGYDDLLVSEPATASQTPITSFSGAVTWIQGLPSCAASACTVFTQLSGATPLIPDPDAEIGTLVLTAVAEGVLVLTTGLEDPVRWFGAAPPADISVTIVPEPATLPLLAMGLLGLASRRRSKPGADQP